MDFAADGDRIELTDGVFQGPGNSDVDFLGKAVTVASQHGSGATTVDCGGVRRAFLFHCGELSSSAVVGVTIYRGQATEGGGILVDGAAPTISGCRFLECQALTNGGAIRIVRGAPQITACEFLECSAAERGGAILTGPEGNPEISACLFEACTAPVRGGALYIYSSPATVTDCVFRDNHSFLGGGVALNNFAALFTRCTFYKNETDTRGGGGALWACDMLGHPVLENCTLYDNGASADNGAIYLNGGASAALGNTLIAFNRGLAILCVDTATATLGCCDLYGNTSGDWVGAIASQYGSDGNIGADPFFCDPSTPTLEIGSDSPCRPFPPSNPDCDLIGAWGIGCGITPVEAASWGAVKARFR
jgi:hypothetical protein